MNVIEAFFLDLFGLAKNTVEATHEVIVNELENLKEKKEVKAESDIRSENGDGEPVRRTLFRIRDNTGLVRHDETDDDV